ncbi:MAG: small subunit ribosomal protein S9 [Candidatus Woesearchaeota archaeon]|jgi:small subunit ribosomal protein S9
MQTSGTRKRSVARATIKPGKGSVKINSIPLPLFEPAYLRMRISEALLLAGKASETVDIAVRVAGGGINGQADATRLAIGRAMVAFSKDDKIKTSYLEYDRTLLVADVRRKEMSKPNCRGKARRKRQKSYR